MMQLHPHLIVLINDTQQLEQNPQRDATTDTVIQMGWFDIMRRAHADNPGKAFQINA